MAKKKNYPKKSFLIIAFLLIMVLVALLIPKIPKESFLTGEEIAIQALKSNYGEKGIYAGQHQFKDYWARDSFFASLGAISIGDYEIVKKNLELFAENQKEDGQIPLRVGAKRIEWHFLGIHPKQEIARYTEDKKKNTPLDQNCLYIIVAEAYINKTQNYAFGKKHYKSLESALEWLERKDSDKNLLVEEDEFAGWTDSLKKKGEVLFTNVCYYKSTASLGKIQEHLGKENTYFEKSEKIKRAINDNFWNGEYFIDFIYENEKKEYFSTEANLLAIAWNVSNASQSEKIMQSIGKFGLRSYTGILNSGKKYPLSLKSGFLIAVGLEDYHDGLYWGWISALDAIALKKTNQSQKSVEVLRNMELLFKKYGEVYEVYEKSGEPVQRILYRSERPFAWSAGMYLYAKNYK